MRFQIFDQCIRALQANDFEAVERLLRTLELPSNQPRSLALAEAIRIRASRKKQSVLSKLGGSEIVTTVPSSERESDQGYPQSRQARTAPAFVLTNVQHRGGILLSNLEEAPLLPGVSLVAGCMNRGESLLKVIKSWLATNADEIVIVDWSSAVELRRTLAAISDPRLRIVRIDGEQHWVLTHAVNVGLRFARHQLVYKVDCDIELLPGFLESNRPELGAFVRGFWKSGLVHGGEGQRFINGTFGAYKTDLHKASYYDERIVTYGWDDSDLYSRLTHDLGLAGRQIDPRTLRHLDQSQQERTANQAVVKNSFMGRFAPTEFEGAKNHYYTVIAGTWGPWAQLQDYMFHKLEARYWRGVRVTKAPMPNPEFIRLAELLAAKQLSVWALSSMPGSGASEEIGVEFASLVRDAHGRGKSEELVNAIADGRKIILVTCAFGPCYAAVHSTLKVLRSNYASFADSIVIANTLLREGQEVGDETNADNVLFASGTLIESLRVRAGAKRIHSVAEFVRHVVTRTQAAIHLSISPRALADEAKNKADALPENLIGIFESAEAPVPSSCLVTSLYDEQNLLRLTEYLACLVVNLKVFERVVVFYEASNGLLPSLVQEIAERVSVSPGRLLLLPFPKRPTFDELFSIKTVFPSGTVVTVANADVAFDQSFSRIVEVDLTRHVVVLSRRDLSPDQTRARPIRLGNGTPNTFSADAWIVKTPFESDFFLDYEIGTFHCDSFINHQLNSSKRYNALNLCLDVRVFHLHDERFNSSAEKQVRDALLIQERYDYERKRNNDVDPIRGVPWMSTASTPLLAESLQYQTWKPTGIFVDLKTCACVSLGHILALVYILSEVRSGLQDAVTVIRLNRPDLDGTIGALLLRCQAQFGWTNMMFDIGGQEEHAEAIVGDATVSRQASFDELIDAISQGNLKPAYELLEWPSRQGLRFLRCDISGAISASQELEMLEAFRGRKQLWEAMVKLFDGLPDHSPEKSMLTPFVVPHLKCPIARNRAAMPIHPRPTVSFITSLFQGGPFLKGYLENVLTAAKEAEGEIIIIDANTQDDDSLCIGEFLKQHPDARKYIDYVRLVKDPGLYECWRLAITRSRADLITNANIDDRRCPSHTARLVNLLSRHGEFSGACGSISCVRQGGTGAWFSLYANELWFYCDGIREISFEDLFAMNDHGDVVSRDFMHCMPVWRKSLHSKFGFFDEQTYGTSADWAFWLRCAKAGERFIFDPSAFGQYFLNPQSHNRRNDPDGLKERRIIKDLIGVDQFGFSKQ